MSPKRNVKSKWLTLNQNSIEKDAQLLANRIALLKQEEMKTWKKIEETKKRTKEISTLK
jgi:ferredoxin-fold anticodon binding domain-containing protein